LLCSEKKFRTIFRNIYFFCHVKRNFFFKYLILGCMTKTLNHIIFFFLHQNQNIFFSNIGIQNIFLEKNHTSLQHFLCRDIWDAEFVEFIETLIYNLFLLHRCIVYGGREASWLWSYGTCSWIYNYLCNQYLSPLMLLVRI
jgi:hypothetical protein